MLGSVLGFCSMAVRLDREQAGGHFSRVALGAKLGQRRLRAALPAPRELSLRLANFEQVLAALHEGVDLSSGRAPGPVWWGAEGRWLPYPLPAHDFILGARARPGHTHLQCQCRARPSNTLPSPSLETCAKMSLSTIVLS